MADILTIIAAVEWMALGLLVTFDAKPNIFLDKLHVIFGTLDFSLPATGGAVEDISASSISAVSAAVRALCISKHQISHGRPPFAGRRSRNHPGQS